MNAPTNVGFLRDDKAVFVVAGDGVPNDGHIYYALIARESYHQAADRIAALEAQVGRLRRAGYVAAMAVLQSSLYEGGDDELRSSVDDLIESYHRNRRRALSEEAEDNAQD